MSRKKKNRPNENEALVEMLKDIVRRLGYEVVTRSLSRGDQEVTVRSGSCHLPGRRLVMLDRRATTQEKTIVLVEALKHEELDGIYLPPRIRSLVEGDENGDPSPLSDTNING